MHTLIRVLFAALGMLMVLSPVFGQPPNIVLIISDDQAWTDYGFMGHESIRTPNLDRLASQSLVFPRGYVPASLCRPSLASIITGMYPHEHGITSNDPPLRDDRAEFLRLRERMVDRIDDLPTLPKLLAANGYVSFQSGKWWEGHPSRGGFAQGMTHGDPARGGRHGDEGLKIGREGLGPVFDFIERAGDRPFFIWYAPFLPHTPHNPPEALLDPHRGKTDSIHVARYWAMCEWFDQTCGELLDHLDERGLSDDTIVLYVTDNGWIQNVEKGGYAPRSKLSPYDGGLRTPIMVRWPGRVTPGTEDTPVSSIDLAPTILHAAGLAPDARMRGVNLLDIQVVRSRDAIYGATFTHNAVDVDDPSSNVEYRWIITGRWKLIEPGANAADGPGGLFDLRSDPFEREDLRAGRPVLAASLRERLAGWWQP